MRALVYTAARHIEWREVPEPRPGPGEVAVAVEAVGICGSDLHAYLGDDERRPPPLVLGHEACGVALGGRHAGRRVVVNPLVTCGRCDACLGGRSNLCAERQIISMPPRPGAFAERLVIPEANLLPVPPSVEPVHAALGEPLATALHALVLAGRALWRPLGEARALVAGGGAVGLGAALLLRARGCREVWVAETNPLRRAALAHHPGLRAFDPAAGGGPPDGGVELVVDAVGAAATRALASRVVAPGGVIVHVGLHQAGAGLDVRRLTLQEVCMIGSYTYTMVDFRAALAAIEHGELGTLDWLEVHALEDGPQAFAALAAGRTAAAKVVLRAPEARR